MAENQRLEANSLSHASLQIQISTEKKEKRIENIWKLKAFFCTT